MAESNSTTNVKLEFAEWLLKNAPESYTFYLGSYTNSVVERLDEINSYFPDMDLFTLKFHNPSGVIEYIEKNISNKKARLRNPAFSQYDKKNSNGIPKAVIGKNNYLTFLKQRFNSIQEKHFWIFQGNPEIYNIEKALRAGHLKSWKVAAHKDKIKFGDKIILWQTGEKAGCYALAEVASEVGDIQEESYEKQYYKNSIAAAKEEDRVKIKITNYLADNPVLWADIKELPDFQHFKAGNQGTNFTATEEEYNKIKRMSVKVSHKQYWLYSLGKQAKHWEELYSEGIIAIGWDRLGDLQKYSTKEEVIEKLQEWENSDSSKKNDATACDDFLKKIKKGDVIIVKKGKRTLLGYGVVTSDYFYDAQRPYFQKCRKVDWKQKGSWNTEFDIVTKTLTDITPYKTEDPNYNTYYERLLGIMSGDKSAARMDYSEKLNRILYGPPGTGKTFQLQDSYFKEFTVQETSLNREQYLENIISDLKWWQVAAIVLLDIKKSKVTDIVSHELLLMKTKLSNSKNPNATIWGYLQHYTDPECEYVKVADRSSNPIFYKDQNSYWEVKEDLLEQFYPEAYSILEEVKNYHPNPDKFIKNYEFVTFHQSFSYEDFIEGIKPNLDEEENNVSYRIEDGIFKKMCLKADADRENPYALFIDEINRGNVSSIFGELITLIEDDKRLGEENELRAKLPYSKTELGVPPNLHIIGTMNTADRSVEALDTALRRRFVFEEIMPRPELLRNIDFDGFSLEELLITINERIEALLDRDHTIGHSYFIKINSGDTEALQEAFENKIIPLLQEYFYHDYEKVALILGAGFVERKEGKVSFAEFSKLDLPEVLPSYHLKEVEDIESAVRILLNREDEAGE